MLKEEKFSITNNWYWILASISREKIDFGKFYENIINLVVAENISFYHV